MKTKGFTLIELMIAITIMMIMTSVVLFNYNRFNESSLLNTFAYDMSLTIRQAQVYGVASREGKNSQSSAIGVNNASDSLTNFTGGYGVHFDSSKTSGVIPLKLFIDTPTENQDDDTFVGNGKFDEGVDFTLQSYSFQRGIKISQICATVAGSVENCNFQQLDITFHRPDPEAIIPVADDVFASSARIVLQNADTSISKSVVVYSTGQISVQ